MAREKSRFGAWAAVYREAAVLLGAEDGGGKIQVWISAGGIAALFGAQDRGNIFFVQKLDPETVQNSLCEIAFFFTKLSIFRLRAKFLKNGG